MKITFTRTLATLTLLVASVAYAQEPAQNIDPARHGNLAQAQQLLREAYDRLGNAQQANHSELGGHAARAKELLRQAADEIKLAAEAANRR